jgi:protease IV
MNLLHQILSSVWMLSPKEAQSLLPTVQSFLKNQTVDMTSIAVKSAVRGYHQDNQPDQKVLVIPIIGVIMKYDYCGDMGMTSLERLLNQTRNDSSIGAIVFDIDSGGGQATYMDHIAKLIRDIRSEKPILIHFSNLCCSAAYYLAAQATAIYASSVLDEVGSIGTMCGLYKPNENSTDAYVLENFYATKSTEKNKDYRDAINGDPKALTAGLDRYNQEFHANVRLGRPNLDESCYGGISVFAEEGIKLGLIDGIKRLDEVIDEAFSLITSPTA